VRTLVIGGGGHIGSFLVPRLVRAGHEVTTISRGTGRRYTDGPEWSQVTEIRADRAAEDAAGTLGRTVLAQEPEVVIDLICYSPSSARALVEALRGRTAHLVHCGSLWRYGASLTLPIREDSEGGAGCAGPPLDEYGIQKDQISRMLATETADGGLVTTTLHPGHVTGPGWCPIGPLGNLDPTVWRRLASGQPLPVPDGGAQLLSHVHADDVAQAFERTLSHRGAAAGQDFNIVSTSALTVRGYATLAAGWFGRSARLEAVGWDRFREGTSAEHAELSRRHLCRSHLAAIDKARRLLGYRPRYRPQDAIHEALEWLSDRGRLDQPLTG